MIVKAKIFYCSVAKKKMLLEFSYNDTHNKETQQITQLYLTLKKKSQNNFTLKIFRVVGKNNQNIGKII